MNFFVVCYVHRLIYAKHTYTPQFQQIITSIKIREQYERNPFRPDQSQPDPTPTSDNADCMTANDDLLLYFACCLSDFQIMCDVG